MTVKELMQSLEGLHEETPVVVTFRDGQIEHFQVTGIYENDKILEIEIEQSES
jgi:hypothetical protein